MRFESTGLRVAVNSLSDVTAVILDLRRVSLIDAGGLAVMLDLRRETQSQGIGFKLMNLPRHLDQLMAITRLDSVFEVTFRVLTGGSNESQASGAELAPCA